MHPYDNIPNRNECEFPFKLFESYEKFFAVDWRASEADIVAAFARAADLRPAPRIEYANDADMPILVHEGLRLGLRFPDNRSRQDCMARVLQSQFGIRHSIRYLNHAAPGDTAYFAVESQSTWDRLESSYSPVKWFFTPIDKLPDIFNTAFDELGKAGKVYAIGLKATSSPL